MKILIIILVTLISSMAHGQVNIEHEIISSLIKAKFKPLPNDTVFNENSQVEKISNSKPREIILLTQTETFLFDPKINSLEMFKMNGLPSLDKDCYSDFKKKNKSNIQIDSISEFNGTIKYVSNREIESIFKQGGWGKFHTTYGYTPLVKISRPGINRDKTKAFIYYSSLIDGLAGAGYYLILEKRDNEMWVITKSKLAWIA